jgi:chemotaxis protein methyltransferase CheR
LIESELFGHEKGAFSGAHAARTGRFELADKATLFLDEIGELPIELQPKLLRVIQEGEFEKLGSSQTIKTDVRVIAATNRDLEKEVKTGRFRKDLWFRLNVFPITVPPLKERKEDIPLLTNFFVNKFSKKIGKQIKNIPKGVMNALKNYDWPGNIRELENMLERSVITTQNYSLNIELPRTGEMPFESEYTLDEMERRYIRDILDKSNWIIEGGKGASKKLGLKPSTLRNRMKKLGITRDAVT